MRRCQGSLSIIVMGKGARRNRLVGLVGEVIVGGCIACGCNIVRQQLISSF